MEHVAVEFSRSALGDRRSLSVMLVTVEEDVATVVVAVQRGAVNYLIKPVAPAVLLAAAEKALARRSLPPSGAQDDTAHDIVGASAAILRVRHLVALASRSDVNVFIAGETGTGKELVARAIHRLSRQGSGSFVPHNCALTPPDMFDGEFFGHVRGAFTGAHRDRQGLLRPRRARARRSSFHVAPPVARARVGGAYGRPRARQEVWQMNDGRSASSPATRAGTCLRLVVQPSQSAGRGVGYEHAPEPRMTESSCEQALRRSRRGLWAALVLVGPLASAFVACGGTNGMEGLPQPSTDASTSDSSAGAGPTAADGGSSDVGATNPGLDSTLSNGDAAAPDATTAPPSSSDGGFDAVIVYADAARLDVYIPNSNPTGDAGSDAAPNPWDLWPPCGPDVPLLDDGGNFLGEAPDTHVYDSGSCATYPWFQTYSSTATGAADAAAMSCDDCLRANAYGIGAASLALGGGGTGIVPPCSDLREAGTAQAGNGAQHPLFELCAKLFECVENSNCANSQVPANVSNCYCGTNTGSACLNPGAPNGACRQQIEDAFQADPTTTATTILEHLTDTSRQSSYAAAEIMTVFNDALPPNRPNCPMCFPRASADGG